MSKESTPVLVNQKVVQEAEKTDIIRFSPEARLALETAGFRIYELLGDSIGEMQESGGRFIFDQPLRGGTLPQLRTRFSEVAINQSSGFRTNTATPRLTIGALKGEVEIFGLNTRQQLGVADIESVVGNAADYSQILIQNLRETGNYFAARVTTFGTSAANTGFVTRRTGNEILTSSFSGRYLGVGWRFGRGRDNKHRNEPRIRIRASRGKIAFPLIVPKDSLSDAEIRSRDSLYTTTLKGSKVEPGNPQSKSIMEETIEAHQFWSELVAGYEEFRRIQDSLQGIVRPPTKKIVH